MKFKAASLLLMLGLVTVLGACQGRDGGNETQQPTSPRQQDADNRTQPNSAENKKESTDSQRDGSDHDNQSNDKDNDHRDDDRPVTPQSPKSP